MLLTVVEVVRFIISASLFRRDITFCRAKLIIPFVFRLLKTFLFLAMLVYYNTKLHNINLFLQKIFKITEKTKNFQTHKKVQDSEEASGKRRAQVRCDLRDLKLKNPARLLVRVPGIVCSVRHCPGDGTGWCRSRHPCRLQWPGTPDGNPDCGLRCRQSGSLFQ